MLLGASTGAIVAAALADTQRSTHPQTMLLLNPDRGDRYLETVYNADWLTAQGINILQNTNLIAAIGNLLPVPLDIVGRSQE
jgi:cysteine synthase A